MNTGPKFTPLFVFAAVGVWLEYVQFAIGGMSEPGGIESTRDVFEQGITSVGLHVTKGAMLWEAYREFENAILLGLQVFRIYKEANTCHFLILFWSFIPRTLE